MAYPTLTDLKTYLGVGGTGEDTLLTSILAGAQANFERRCNRKFEVGAAAVRNYPAEWPFVQRRGRRLVLFADLVAITTLTNGDSAVIAATEYELVPNDGPPYDQINLHPLSGYRFTWDGVTPIKINATWGYAVTIPDDVKQGIIELAALDYWDRQGTSQKGSPLWLKTEARIKYWTRYT